MEIIVDNILPFSIYIQTYLKVNIVSCNYKFDKPTFLPGDYITMLLNLEYLLLIFEHI